MRVTIASEKNSANWDSFVSRHERCVNYHCLAWKRVIEQAFGWKAFFLMADEEGKIACVLSLVRLKGKLFGNLLCSLPFFSEAGLVAESSEAIESLLKKSILIAQNGTAEYIELRHRGEAAASWSAKTNKATLECDVSPDAGDKICGASPRK